MPASLAQYLQSAVQGWIREQSEVLRRRLEAQNVEDLDAFASDLEHLASQIRQARRYLLAPGTPRAVSASVPRTDELPADKRVSGLTAAQWYQAVVEAVTKVADPKTGAVRARDVVHYVGSKVKPQLTVYDHSRFATSRTAVWQTKVYGLLRQLLRQRVLLPTKFRGVYRLASASSPAAQPAGEPAGAPSGVAAVRT